MNADTFFDRLTRAAAEPPPDRHAQFSELHHEVYGEYSAALRGLTPEQAARSVHLGDETRTVLQVVGHIMEWDRFMILSAGDILAGVQHPRMITDINGYIEPDGARPAFQSIDAFNHYQAEKHASWPWERMRAAALDAATTLHTLFTTPALLHANRLEGTRLHRKRLPNGTVIPNIAMGWALWITCLEHAGVEHAPDLGMPH